MAETKRTLDLRTALTPERDVLNLNGTLYEVRDEDELSIADQLQLEEVGKRARALVNGSEVPEDDPILERRIRDAVRRIVVDLPPEEEERLPWRARLEIIAFFSTGVVAKRLTPKPTAPNGQAQPRKSQRSGSSRVSSASTGATPKGGSASLSAS